MVDLAIRPVSHGSEIPLPQPPSNSDGILSESQHLDALASQNESSSDFSVESDLNDLRVRSTT